MDTTTKIRRPRSDGQRNRDRVLLAAIAAFKEAGASEVTLESIARRAGVGIGTLYRHFPSREALVEAAYRGELAQLCDNAAELLESLPADIATRTWMDRFADYVAAKRGMADTLRALVASGTVTSSDTRERLTAAIETLLSAGASSGALRDGLDAADVFAALTGIFLATEYISDPSLTQRLLDLLMQGLRDPTRITRPRC